MKESREVKISIFDESGKTIKELEGTNDTGLNMATWDLTFEGGKKVCRGFATAGNYVNPGEYKVQILAGDLKLEGKIQVESPHRF